MSEPYPFRGTEDERAAWMQKHCPTPPTGKVSEEKADAFAGAVFRTLKEYFDWRAATDLRPTFIKHTQQIEALERRIAELERRRPKWGRE